jgi:hypothetical protein
VSYDNQHIVFQHLYPPTTAAAQPPLLEPGATVRISRAKHIFVKGYAPNFTEEIFTVLRRIKPTRHHPNESVLYVLEDSLGERINGTFYPYEVLAVTPPSVFPVERVLRYRQPKDQPREALVRWLGYPKKFDSWIPAQR